MVEKPEQANKANKAAKTDWKGLHLWQIQGVRDVLVGLGVLGLLWLGQRISVVTVPLLLAIFLAYLFEPLIVWLMGRLKLSRRSAVASIVIAAILFVGLPAVLGGAYAALQLTQAVDDAVSYAQVVKKAVNVADKLDESEPAGQADTPDAGGEVGAAPPSATPGTPPETPDPNAPPAGDEESPGLISHAIESVKGFFFPPPESARPEVEAVFETFRREHNLKKFSPFWRGIFHRVRDSHDETSGFGKLLGAAIDWVDANRDQVAISVASFGAQTVTRAARLGGAIFGVGFMAFITLFFFVFVATEWIKLKGFGARLLPDRNRDQTIHLLGRFDAVVSGFIRGRLTIAFLQAIVFSVAYFIIGVPGAFLLGPTIAVLSIVPYLALVGLPISMALLVAGNHEDFRAAWWWVLGAPTAVYFVGQALDDYVWTPIIQGKSTGMDTPTILFASLAGGALFGVFGLLIAIPIAACLKILIQELFWPRFKAWAEGKEKDFLPIGRD
ncbi:MAG: AI-2E family transporter [Phycisphaerales bacterium]|nr:AI-2E family transporter [Phycisphaerales bacterium]